MSDRCNPFIKDKAFDSRFDNVKDFPTQQPFFECVLAILVNDVILEHNYGYALNNWIYFCCNR